MSTAPGNVDFVAAERVRIIVIRGDRHAQRTHEVLHADMLTSAADRLISEIEATVSECSACGGPWTDCTEDCAND
jgi:hypothetical protein